MTVARTILETHVIPEKLEDDQDVMALQNRNKVIKT